MGVVLKAFDEKLQRVVAIKVMAEALAASPAARKRFVREAQAAAAVRSDHIVNIYEVEESGSRPYLVMELISGVSLQERLDAAGPLGVREILRIGLQIAQGLAAAHAQGVVHRDISPANILLENGVERVKITDFGLARVADDATHSASGIVAGTPQYMAPEQVCGEPVDQRSDLFSLGSVLYAMCTGRSPFRAETTVAVLRRVCDEAAAADPRNQPRHSGLARGDRRSAARQSARRAVSIRRRSGGPARTVSGSRAAAGSGSLACPDERRQEVERTADAGQHGRASAGCLARGSGWPAAVARHVQSDRGHRGHRRQPVCADRAANCNARRAR